LSVLKLHFMFKSVPACIALLAACAAAMAAEPMARIDRLEQLTIATGRIRFAIYGDGVAELWGGLGAEVEGLYTKTLSARDIRRVKREIERADYFTIHQPLPQPEEPMACLHYGETTTSVRADGRSRTIRRRSCPFLPPHRLGRFEDAIYRIVGAEQWVKAEAEKARNRPAGARDTVEVPAYFEAKNSRADVVALHQLAASSGNCRAASRLLEIYATEVVSDEQRGYDDDWYLDAKARGCALPALPAVLKR